MYVVIYILPPGRRIPRTLLPNVEYVLKWWPLVILKDTKDVDLLLTFEKKAKIVKFCKIDEIRQNRTFDLDAEIVKNRAKM